MNKYIVLGASPNPLRHSNKAVKSLLRRERDVIPIGFRKGSISGKQIVIGTPEVEGVLTVLLYLGAKRQEEYYDYLIGLNPKRIVFNPGTENNVLEELATKNGIEVISDCALVMINSGVI